MTSNVHIRRVSSPAYYLGRPAALWLAAFAPRPADHDSGASERHDSSATAHEATL
jgi:hypothetical protein